MATYTLPREAFELLEDAFGDRQKADKFAKAIEAAIASIDKKAEEIIVDKKEHIKIELKDDLRNELVTKDLFEERFKRLEVEMNERFKVIDEQFKRLNFKLNIFIAIALIALTFANPTFIRLIEKIFAL
jgi:hypothetical protein